MQTRRIGTPVTLYEVRRRTVAISVGSRLFGLAGMITLLASGHSEAANEAILPYCVCVVSCTMLSCRGARTVRLDRTGMSIDGRPTVHWGDVHGFHEDRSSGRRVVAYRLRDGASGSYSRDGTLPWACGVMRARRLAEYLNRWHAAYG